MAQMIEKAVAPLQDDLRKVNFQLAEGGKMFKEAGERLARLETIIEIQGKDNQPKSAQAG